MQYFEPTDKQTYKHTVWLTIENEEWAICFRKRKPLADVNPACMNRAYYLGSTVRVRKYWGQGKPLFYGDSPNRQKVQLFEFAYYSKEIKLDNKCLKRGVHKFVDENYEMLLDSIHIHNDDKELGIGDMVEDRTKQCFIELLPDLTPVLYWVRYPYTSRHFFDKKAGDELLDGIDTSDYPESIFVTGVPTENVDSYLENLMKLGRKYVSDSAHVRAKNIVLDLIKINNEGEKRHLYVGNQIYHPKTNTT